jgi:hypothetical protein
MAMSRSYHFRSAASCAIDTSIAESTSSSWPADFWVSILRSRTSRSRMIAFDKTAHCLLAESLRIAQNHSRDIFGLTYDFLSSTPRPSNHETAPRKSVPRTSRTRSNTSPPLLQRKQCQPAREYENSSLRPVEDGVHPGIGQRVRPWDPIEASSITSARAIGTLSRIACVSHRAFTAKPSPFVTGELLTRCR